MNIIGIGAHFHDASCCLLQNAKMVAAAQEERFSRIKHDPVIPGNAFRYCLREAGLSVRDIDCVAYYENPRRKLGRQLWTLMPRAHELSNVLLRLDPLAAEREIRELLGYEGRIVFVDHHAAHAASSFFFSGFAEAAILTVDGVGEWTCGTYGWGLGPQINIFEEVRFPHSLGLLYSMITDYLGFAVNDGEYKVMGLAPYGRPIYTDKIRTLAESGDKGQYRLNLKYFDFQRLDRMYSDELLALFGKAARQPREEIEQFHQDVARSLQFVLEEMLLDKSAYLQRETGSGNLCMAGGVALNCVANGRILRDGPFERLFVPPAASDAGGATGAAALAHYQLDKSVAVAPLKSDYLGPQFGYEDARQIVAASGVPADDYHGREAELLDATAYRLARGKVVGWFHGRMEFGPRALGARSILADPRGADMRTRINKLVKKRESFRPFAPVVLESEAAEHFDLDHPSPYMLETCQVRSRLDLPAITHLDGSARVQTLTEAANPRFAGLLMAFYRSTGCPILLNTSFNMNDEPIVCTPANAFACFLRSEIDALVLEDFILDRPSNSAFPSLLRMMPGQANSAVNHHVYAMF
jgi:carbamoyltransferase